MSNQYTKSLLHIASKTWVKDSNGLFDYESKQTKNLKAFIGESICITRRGYDLSSAKKLSNQKNEETLFNIIKSNDTNFNIENKIHNHLEPTEKNISCLNNKLWYIVNSDPTLSSQISTNHFHSINKDYYITKNDIIKLGRVKYIVSEINIINGEEKKEDLNLPEKNESNKGNYINEINSKIDSPFDLIYKAKSLYDENENVLETNNDEKQLCKICYSEDNDKINNPMVHLCNCKGGLNYAHFECIKQWMKTKLIEIENAKKTVKTYYIPSFNCEICKTPYPYKFTINNNNKIYNLIDIEKPMNTNYIILESLNQIKENCNIKSIHVISLVDNNDIFIGRGHDCDVRIKDISVSRFHAKFKYDMNEKTLLIKDLKSKFGTLILIKTPFDIKESIQFQIGRTYIKASLLTFEDLMQFQQKKQMEKQKKALEDIQTIQNENIYKKENNYEPLETEYKENGNDKLRDNNNMRDNNNNMDIDDN